MKKLTTYSAILISMMFAACNKNADTLTNPGTSLPPVKTTTQLKFPVRIATVTKGQTDTAVTVISYDEKNRITSLKTGASEYKLRYNGNDLASYSTYADGNLNSTYAFKYNGGEPVSAKLTTSMFEKTYLYTVTGDRVVKRQDTDGLYELSYTGNDLQAVKGLGLTTYEYGPHKSPFYNVRLKYVLLTPFQMVDMFSEHNLIKNTSETTPRFRGGTYTYVIDGDGFPRSVTIKATELLDPTKYRYTDITYTYKTVKL